MQKKTGPILMKVYSWLKTMMVGLGLLFSAMLILSFTTWPYWGIYDLAMAESEYEFTPDYIVVMGGSGVPSKSALIRMYHAADLAKAFPKAKVIIALPDSALSEDGALMKMKNELSLRKANNSVFFENKGTNTRSQALNIKEMLERDNYKLLIVSAPEHLYRSILSFRKVGFQTVGGHPAFENDLQVSLEYQSKQLGGKHFIPDVGSNQQVRYQFWNHLQYEIVLLREYTAILYYKLNGWI
jgi:uncharacterized SAM-binding protein YcdF (DUF218 family)